MTRRHLAWTIAAFLHLVLVVCGAASVVLSGRNLALGILAQYSEISGADTQYGFFAPAVASQCRALLRSATRGVTLPRAIRIFSLRVAGPSSSSVVSEDPRLRKEVP